LLPGNAANVFVHIGNGNNMIMVEPDHDLVVVLRWIDTNNSADQVLKAMVDALKN
jgi:hypothetical protein